MFIDKGQKMTVTAPDGRTIPVRLEVNPRARRLILKLDERKREAVAIAPSKRQLAEAAGFAAERAKWIADALAKIPLGIPFTPGEIIPFRGEDLHLSIEGSGRLARIEESENELILRAPGMEETFAGRVTRFLKKAAREDLDEAVSRHCATLGVGAKRITVKDTRTRWGSCTADGHLAFSWRLVCAPPEVLDYVAAHECAHLLEMNHSSRFWAHVDRCMHIDWKLHRHWLQKHGAGLHAIGMAA